MILEKSNKLYVLKLVIVLFMCALLIVGVTYAFWIWTSNINKNVVFKTMNGIEEYIVYNEGNSYFVGNFQPTDNFCESVSTTVSFYKRADISEYTVVASIKMDVNSIGSNILQSSDVYWVITSGDSSITCADGFNSSNVLSYGNFNSITDENNTLELLSDIYVSLTEKKYTVWIWIDSLGSNLSSLSGEYIDTNVWTEIEMMELKPYNELILNGADPVLHTGMIPVIIDDNGGVITADMSEQWYNYENKQWANAVLVDSSVRSSYYEEDDITIKANQTVSQSDILAYYVWIPNFSYKMNGDEEEISIVFNKKLTDYIAHPAFNFNGEISGFWVGKFETTGTGELPTILPNVNSLTGNVDASVSNGLIDFFKVSLKFAGGIFNDSTGSITFSGSNVYGLPNGADSHLMKNSEWGAVAYLSHSVYGINDEVRTNNYVNSTTNNTLTGCGALSSSTSSSSSCGILYGVPSNEENSYPQSTTGNISGVFDMSGANYEYVMGVYYIRTVDYSGFNMLPDSKYYDLYEKSGNVNCEIGTCGGHALYETAGWYGDTEYFVYDNAPWFMRGGRATSSNPGIFYSSTESGTTNNNTLSFRSVVI